MTRIILIVGIAVGLLTLVIDAYISYAFVSELSSSIQQKDEKLDDISRFEQYLSLLKDAETGQRGYVITGNQTYLEPYQEGLKYLNSAQTQEFLENSEKLKDLQEDVKQLKGLTREKVDELQFVIEKYNTSGFQAAREIISSNSGKNTMDKIRVLINDILTVKHRALEKHEKENNIYINFIIDLIVSVNIIYLILMSICLYILYVNSEKEEKS